MHHQGGPCVRRHRPPSTPPPPPSGEWLRHGSSSRRSSPLRLCRRRQSASASTARVRPTPTATKHATAAAERRVAPSRQQLTVLVASPAPPPPAKHRQRVSASTARVRPTPTATKHATAAAERRVAPSRQQLTALVASPALSPPSERLGIDRTRASDANGHRARHCRRRAAGGSVTAVAHGARRLSGSAAAIRARSEGFGLDRTRVSYADGHQARHRRR